MQISIYSYLESRLRISRFPSSSTSLAWRVLRTMGNTDRGSVVHGTLTHHSQGSKGWVLQRRLIRRTSYPLPWYLPQRGRHWGRRRRLGLWHRGRVLSRCYEPKVFKTLQHAQAYHRRANPSDRIKRIPDRPNPEERIRSQYGWTRRTHNLPPCTTWHLSFCECVCTHLKSNRVPVGPQSVQRLSCGWNRWGTDSLWCDRAYSPYQRTCSYFGRLCECLRSYGVSRMLLIIVHE